MQINLVADSSVTSAPAGFTAAVEAAASIFEQAIPGNYTVNLRYGWGTFDNSVDDILTNASSQDFSLGGSFGQGSVSYANVKSWLSNAASLSDQMAAVASLPSSYTALPNDADDFYVSYAEEKALGVFSGAVGAIDGAIGFDIGDGSDPGYWETAALCEIGHALGWDTEYYSSQPGVLDLYRFASTGSRQWQGGQPAYFSINNGVTNLAEFSTTFDYTLFTNVANNDPFNVNGDSVPATALTSLDLEVLHAIGFGGAQKVDDNVSQTAPETVEASAGQTTAIAGVQVVDGDLNGETISTLVSASSGVLSASGAGVSGSGTDSLSISGTLAQVNAALLTLGYLNATPGVDPISVTTTDSSSGSVATSSIYALIESNNGVDAPALPSNFAAAGVSDVLWRDSNGEVAIWNTTAGSSKYVSKGIGYVSNDWQIAGVGDFNGSGVDGVIWRDSNGDVTTWNASAASPESFGAYGGATYYVSNDWQIAGVGNFNGDGLSDVLWRNTNGDVDIWYAEAGSPTSFAAQPVVDAGSGNQVDGVGDFNGVGKDGILLRNATTGDVTLWNAKASTSGFATTDLGDVSSDWSIAGVGDFTGSGQSDVLWRDANGELAIWAPNAQATGYYSIGLGDVSADWRIAGVGHYNGDSKSDILWRNANTGDVTIWESNAGSLSFTAVNLGVVSADWQIAAK